jgi:hypothetical protein
MNWFKKSKPTTPPIRPWMGTTLTQWRSSPECLVFAADPRWLKMMAVLRNGLPVRDVGPDDAMKEYGRSLMLQDVLSALELMRVPETPVITEPVADYSDSAMQPQTQE